jgi:hypothetical protein
VSKALETESIPVGNITCAVGTIDYDGKVAFKQRKLPQRRFKITAAREEAVESLGDRQQRYLIPAAVGVG